MTLSVVFALLGLVAAGRFVDSSADQSGRFSWGDSDKSLDSSSTSTSSSSDDDDADSSTLRRERFDRDQRRIELAVQQALLQDKQENPLPVRATVRAASFQFAFTTLLDQLPGDSIGASVNNPTFGPAAVVSYVSPAEGLFGPARVRTQAVALDTARDFTGLFAQVRRAGFLGEFELRTLVQAESTFDLTSRALFTPCFPVTDEPGLQIELVVLVQNGNGQVRKKWLAVDRFFDQAGEFVDEFQEEIPMSRFNDLANRFDETDDAVVEMHATHCQQFSYFA